MKDVSIFLQTNHRTAAKICEFGHTVTFSVVFCMKFGEEAHFPGITEDFIFHVFLVFKSLDSRISIKFKFFRLKMFKDNKI